jgi:hypothetical protein
VITKLESFTLSSVITDLNPHLQKIYTNAPASQQLIMSRLARVNMYLKTGGAKSTQISRLARVSMHLTGGVQQLQFNSLTWVQFNSLKWVQFNSLKWVQFNNLTCVQFKSLTWVQFNSLSWIPFPTGLGRTYVWCAVAFSRVHLRYRTMAGPTQENAHISVARAGTALIVGLPSTCT